MTRRLSPQTNLVLAALARDPATWRHGYDLILEVGLKAGSVYPILTRLRDRGLLESEWGPAPSPGRPRRQLHRLTAAGVGVTGAHRSEARSPAVERAGVSYEPA